MKTVHRYLKTLLVVTSVSFSFGVIGCASTGHRPAATASSGTQEAQVAPAQFGPAPAKITSINTKYQFAVIDFSSHVLPPLGTHMTVYRDGKRVGTVQITEPVRARFATADILEGELRVGDEAR
jgi:hypothetical protein